MNQDEIFSDSNLAPNNWIKFSKIGDNIFGTLTAVREIKSTLPGKEGEMNKVYEIKADGGLWHDTKDKQVMEPAIEVKPGETWNVGGGLSVDRGLQNAKIGQKVAIKFTEERPSIKKGFNPFKVKQVWLIKDKKTGEYMMDTEWIKEQSGGFNEPM